MKSENTKLKASNDAMKEKMKQLTDQLDKMSVNGEKSSKTDTVKDKSKQLKAKVRIQQLKVSHYYNQ